jgi:hypothetical protein
MQRRLAIRPYPVIASGLTRLCDADGDSVAPGDAGPRAGERFLISGRRRSARSSFGPLLSPSLPITGFVLGYCSRTAASASRAKTDGGDDVSTARLRELFLPADVTFVRESV